MIEHRKSYNCLEAIHLCMLSHSVLSHTKVNNRGPNNNKRRAVSLEFACLLSDLGHRMKNSLLWSERTKMTMFEIRTCVLAVVLVWSSTCHAKSLEATGNRLAGQWSLPGHPHLHELSPQLDCLCSVQKERVSFSKGELSFCPKNDRPCDGPRNHFSLVWRFHKVPSARKSSLCVHWLFLTDTSRVHVQMRYWGNGSWKIITEFVMVGFQVP